MHHRRDPDAAHRCKGLPVFCLHIGGQRSVGALQAGMHSLQRVGPDAVLQLVFPSEVPLRHRGMAAIHQHRLDAGRAEFNTECALSEVEHGITPCQILSVLQAGLLPPVSCLYYTRQRGRRPVPAVSKGGFLFKKSAVSPAGICNRPSYRGSAIRLLSQHRTIPALPQKNPPRRTPQTNLAASFSRGIWLGRPDLNRRMEESKSSALPLGDGPL